MANPLKTKVLANEREQWLDQLSDVIGLAIKAGADAADAMMVRRQAISLTYRLGVQEQLERSEGTDLGLRVFIGRRQAVVSSSDFSAQAIKDLVARGVAMAGAVPEDPYCGLAPADQLATEIPDVEGSEPQTPTVDALRERAARAEDAARAVPGVTNSEGAEAAWSRSEIALVASNGFAATTTRSGHSIAVSVLAGTGTAMERDDDHSIAVFAEDLRRPEDVGRTAGERAVRRLNPRKISSAQVPIVFEPRVARSIIGHLATAINGSSVSRGATFLKDKLGQEVFPRTVSIIDDPLRRRGLNSRPFDAEGLPSRPLKVVDGGVLRSWLLDLRSSRQLGLASTAHASRGPSTPPSPAPTNLYLEAGSISPERLLADIAEGFYVTDLIGFGVNGVTGDYSRGASGFWIDQGQLAYPVSEVTIAGNLIDMFANLTPASDLAFRYGINAPTVRIDGMTLAGR